MIEKVILSESVPFEYKHFHEVMDLLVHEPNIISPFILRAEILCSQELNYERRIDRVLLPREKRNKKIWQRMEMKNENGKSLVIHTCFVDQEFRDMVDERADLPFYYPKCKSFTYEFLKDQNKSGGRFSLLAVGRDQETMNYLLQERMMSIWKKIFNHIKKMCIGTMNGYQKRVHHDVVIPKDKYQDKYQELKEKYSEWVNKWPEATDPRKHVFEEVGIAAWLILLWESDETKTRSRMRPEKKRKFVDIGCGNGFLTYILLNEGYSGVGIDLCSRKLWEMFPTTVQANLEERAILPSSEDFSEYEYLIGNHSDELTPWIPLLGVRDECKWIIIPCCLFELNGKKFTKNIPSVGRYKAYCQDLIEFSKEKLGYGDRIEQENLRIPSTKNICIFTRSTDILDKQLRKEFVKTVIADTPFVTKKSDREKTILYLQKKRNREMKNQVE